MGASGRVIVLQGVEIALLQKADAAAVMELLERLPQEVVVIFTYDDAYLAGILNAKRSVRRGFGSSPSAAIRWSFPFKAMLRS